MITLFLGLVYIMFGIYGWLASLELGIALSRLVRPDAAGSRRAQALFTPLWEITNVFLVFGFTGFAVLFSNALPAVSRLLLSTLVVAMVALLARAALVLYVFYGNRPAGNTWYNYGFALASVLVPAAFGAAGIKLLSGYDFWKTAPGIWMMLAMLSGLLALAVCFLAWVGRGDNRQVTYVSRGLNIAFAALTAIGLQLAVNHGLDHLLGLPFVYLMLVVTFVPLWQVGLWRSAAHDESQMWWYLSIIALVAPVLLAFANRPFLAYPSQTVAGAYAATAYGMAGIVGLAIIFPVLMIGFGLLVWLLRTPRSPGSKPSPVKTRSR